MKWIAFNPDWQNSPEPIPSAAATEASEPTSAPDATVKCKVVVAEDDPISREVVSSHLRNWGYDVFIARDGREALEALRAEPSPVLAVLDWMMPELDGVEVCRQVRQMEKMVYVLLLTARSGKEQLVEAFNAGVDDYLVKPFDKDELRARLTAGLRVLTLQQILSQRVNQLEAALAENQSLRLQIPL